jgi:hypothetical protein
MLKQYLKFSEHKRDTRRQIIIPGMINKNIASIILSPRLSRISNSIKECYVNDIGNGVKEIVLNRPSLKNALGAELVSRLNSAIDEIELVQCLLSVIDIRAKNW